MLFEHSVEQAHFTSKKIEKIDTVQSSKSAMKTNYSMYKNLDFKNYI